MEEVNACKIPAECKGWLGIVVDVILGFKMLFLVYKNLEGYLWWRKTKATSFTLTIKFLLIFSTFIVSTLKRYSLFFSDCRRIRIQIFCEKNQSPFPTNDHCLVPVFRHTDSALTYKIPQAKRIQNQRTTINCFCANTLCLLYLDYLGKYSSMVI